MGIFSKFENRMEDTFEGAAGKISKAPISPVQIAKKAEKQMRRETMVGAGKEYSPTLYTVLVNADDDRRLFGYYPTLAGEIETYLEAKATQEGLVMDGHPLVRFVADENLKHGKFDVIAELVAAPVIEQLRAEEFVRYGIAPNPRQAQQAQQAQWHQQPEQPVRQEAAPAGRGNRRAMDQPYPNDAWGRGYNDYAPENMSDDPYGDRPGYDDPEGEGGYYDGDAGYGYEAYLAEPEPEPQPEQPAAKPPLPYVPEEEIDRSIDYGEYTFNSEDFEDYRNKADDDAPESAHDYGEPAMQPANTVAFASAAAAVPDKRVVVARLVDQTYHRPYDLAGSHVTMGRETGNDIVVQDINASRKHAELRQNTRGIWVITDLSSMNGTLVNGVSVASHPLYPGDIVTIGKTDFQFELVKR